MKPGLTCLRQVRGRNEITSFEEWVQLDLENIDQWSHWLDLKILLATIPVTLLGRAAGDSFDACTQFIDGNISLRTYKV
jgi:lipopolysaccharide/colanic/teichoic acid biosynthesis glycosyltransferase